MSSENTDENNDQETEQTAEFDYQKRAKQFVPVAPHHTFDQLIVSPVVLSTIEEALKTIELEAKVFGEWGLSSIQPHPQSALNFYGPSGTGKTLAAEAVASKLGKLILKASYADIESKYHGEGPKMVKSIFLAAEQQKAVLFIDEADSLLSKRLTSVSGGSEQAINSMRSQLLICLEDFRGLVIFATNLNKNYDSAFLTRLINVEFTLPNEQMRRQIWDVHLRGKGIHIPLSEDVSSQKLAEKFPSFSGREIRNSVIKGCVLAAMKGKDVVEQSDLVEASQKIATERAKSDEEDKLHNKVIGEITSLLKKL